MWKEVLFDFVVGGLLIAIVVLVAKVVNPVVGGVLAALPVRLGSSLFLIWYHQGEQAALSAVDGILAGGVGAFIFALTLYFTAESIGFLRSFLAASALCGTAAFVILMVVK